MQKRFQDFKLGGGAHLKKLRRAEGGAKIFGVFRVKNHDFTKKNHIFSNCGGRETQHKMRRTPLYVRGVSRKIGNNIIYLRKIVIFHTKYPKNFRASLRNSKKYDFFLVKS
jgi:hypothetical protein